MKVTLTFEISPHDIPAKHRDQIEHWRECGTRAHIDVENFPILPVGSQVYVLGLLGLIKAYQLFDRQLNVLVRTDESAADYYRTLEGEDWSMSKERKLVYTKTFDFNEQ